MYWNQFQAKVHCWRPRRDLNPCYRRESGSDRVFAGFAWIVQDSPIASNGAGMARVCTLQHLPRFPPVWNSLSHHSVTGFWPGIGPVSLLPAMRANGLRFLLAKSSKQFSTTSWVGSAVRLLKPDAECYSRSAGYESPFRCKVRWLRLFGQVFRFFKWKNCSSRRRGCGNVKIGFIDFHISTACFIAR